MCLLFSTHQRYDNVNVMFISMISNICVKNVTIVSVQFNSVKYRILISQSMFYLVTAQFLVFSIFCPVL